MIVVSMRSRRPATHRTACPNSRQRRQSRRGVVWLSRYFFVDLHLVVALMRGNMAQESVLSADASCQSFVGCIPMRHKSFLPFRIPCLVESIRGS
jgi:hypothetical protein